MAVKSPSVQPTRQRNVLTEARFHVGRDFQKPGEVMDKSGGFSLAQLFWQVFDFVQCLAEVENSIGTWL